MFEKLARNAAELTENSVNESQLQAGLERELETVCAAVGAPWSPYDISVFLGSKGENSRFADSIHGAVVIEYEPPKSFKGRSGRQCIHAQQQAEGYAKRLATIEGRKTEEYTLVVWDGASISFGHTSQENGKWQPIAPFDTAAAEHLVDCIKRNGRPLVSETILATRVGPNSKVGAKLVPVLFNAVVAAQKATPATKTTLLFREWNRLFGQVVGIGDDKLQAFVAKQEKAQGTPYRNDTAAYLFALNTYIAILAKSVAACALKGVAENILDPSVLVRDRMKRLEDGSLFEQSGILNMVSGDFFSWYVSDIAWSSLENGIASVLISLADIDFDISKKSVHGTRDLFKGIYQSCVPRELRHALGEFYTPDWLAEYGMDLLEWKPGDDLLDPTCGSGTFLLEALKRRIDTAKIKLLRPSASELLNGIYGTDLNPLAVLSAKASLSLFVSPYRRPNEQLRLPVFLADTINPAMATGGMYEHELPTEKGVRQFVLPRTMVESPDFFRMMSWLQNSIDDDTADSQIIEQFRHRFPAAANMDAEWEKISETIKTIVGLHSIGWNGIWCSILADRFAAGAIRKVSHICGNPPWVKWSHIPPEYANFIKPRCQALGVFSEDVWVGGIESDISTVITYEALDRYLADNGKLGFFVPGTVFINESSEGFRKFSLHDGQLLCAVRLVEDFKAIKPFDGVSNHPTFLVVEKGAKTRFPVPYRVWDWRSQSADIENAQAFRAACTALKKVARPVPGGRKNECRPWMIESRKDIADISRIFEKRGFSGEARKGVTADRNGIFWVDLLDVDGDIATVRNKPDAGRTKGIPARTGEIEKEHVFPLLRGEDVLPFHAVPSGYIIVPQRGMHGDPQLSENSPRTYAFLRRFREFLKERSSLRRFQPGQAWYSLWSTGAYTFARHKVAWREMAGGDFSAAYVGSVRDSRLGSKIVIPDHKVYFIVCGSAQEAHFVTGFLNAPIVRQAINAYASHLSLGTSVADYVGVPAYDKNNEDHRRLRKLAQRLSKKKKPSDADAASLDRIVRSIL